VMTGTRSRHCRSTSSQARTDYDNFTFPGREVTWNRHHHHGAGRVAF